MSLAVALLVATSIQLGLGVTSNTQQFGNVEGFACENPRESIKFQLWTGDGQKQLRIWCGEEK